jgi:zona occludens toxin
MAIKGYFGASGHGKTYEVVENVILPGLAEGRRIVTNVAGLDFEAMKDYLIDKGVAEEKIGTIVTIRLDEDTCGKLAIIIGDGEDAVLDEKSIIKGGDIFVADEVWRIWEDGTKLHADDRKFLRMHRHLVNPANGLTCEIAIISQSFVDVHRGVRRLMEERYQMTKHIALGMTKSYRVDVYQKGARSPHVSYQKRYNPAVYALYKSHSMAVRTGQEVSIDKRGNILRGAFFKIVIPIGLLVGGLGIYGMVRFFKGPASPGASAATVSGDSRTVPGAAPGAAVAHSVSAAGGPYSERWRLVGYLDFDGVTRVLMEDSGGAIRYLVAGGAVQGWGRGAAVKLEESERAAFFSGGQVRKSEKVDKVATAPVSRAEK